MPHIGSERTRTIVPAATRRCTPRRLITGIAIRSFTFTER
jgi:hypothetical protein